jgi:TonB family protein
MKRAFLVSVWFHLVMIVLVVVPTLHLGRRLLQPSVYQVRVVELPLEPAPAPPEPPRVEPEPPRPVKPPANPKITPPRKKAVAPLPPLKPKPETPPAPVPKPEAPTPPQPQPGPPAPPAPALMVQPKIDAPPEFDCISVGYRGVLQDKLEREWALPSVSAPGPVQAVIVFTINRDGSVDNVSLEKSSGNFYFDQAALRAVLLAAPMPPLPRTLTSSTLRVHAPFTWQGAP